MTPWQLYEECEDKFDTLTNDLDECQRALTSGEDRGTLILQVPKQYAHCELRPLPIRVMLDKQGGSDHPYDGCHSLSNLQDELTLEKTTIFWGRGYNKECNCACLKVGYKERRQKRM